MGWSYHDTQSERLAGELETAASALVAPELLVEFLRLSNHTIGEHLCDWPRARRLGERVLHGRAANAETAMAWASYSVACLLAGEPVQATAAELACLAAAGQPFAALIEARFMLVAALVGSGRVADVAAIYDGALALARTTGDQAPACAIATASNNLASELVEASARSPAEEALMATAADAAHEFWLRCGDWVNEETALYLKALVANALGRPDEALAIASAGLDIIDANTPRPIDAAFLRLTRAQALSASGDKGGARSELALADAAAAQSPSADLKAWFAEERAKAFGQG
jgi:hypothetical protein